MKTREELKKEFLTKFNNLVGRMVKLEVIPHIQSTINERIPERGGFVVYDGTELWNWMEQAIKEAREEIPFGEPLSTYIQWKGTDLCMDWYCIHGHQNHFDGDFAYTVTCEKCSEVYELGESVSLKLS